MVHLVCTVSARSAAEAQVGAGLAGRAGRAGVDALAALADVQPVLRAVLVLAVASDRRAGTPHRAGCMLDAGSPLHLEGSAAQ